MSLKIFSLLTAFVLSVFLLTSFASADNSNVFTITDLSAPSDISADESSFTFTFNLTYTGTSPSATIDFTDSTSSVGSISFSDTTGMDGTVDEFRTVTGTVNGLTSQDEVVDVILNATYSGTRDDETSFSVDILDTTAPVISLLGSAVVTLGVGEEYNDAGATASDNVDGNLTLQIVPVGDVIDTSIAGTYTVTYNVNDTALNQATEVTRTVNVINYFCNAGQGAINDLDLTLNVDINNKGEGEDEEWLPLDTIEIEVELENDKNIDLDDFVFELALYKVGSSKNIIDDMMWISEDDEEVEVGDIDEDEEERHVFKFRVDPSEVEDGNYILKVKAYEDGKEDEICIDYSSDLADSDFGVSVFTAEIEITTEGDEEKMVVVDTESLPKPIKAFCSEEVEFTANIYNIGDEDFPDQIKVTLYNKVLGIDLEKVLEGDLDIGERARALFSFVVPADAEEKQYTLNMRVYYDYDEDDDEYKEISEETFRAFLKVADNCAPKNDTSDVTETEDSKDATSGFFSKITGSVIGVGSSDGWYLWVIGAVNVILVFSIIFVAVRMLRRA